MFKFFKGRFSKVQEAFAKTRDAISSRLATLFKGPIDEETLEEFEQILFEADLGTEVATFFSKELRLFLQKNREVIPKEIFTFLHEKGREILTASPSISSMDKETGKGPKVILIVGVNGSGKTTSMAKLACQIKESGQTVLLAAGDTFRAAAIEQLALLAKQLEIPLIQSQPGADPASVAFDAVKAAQSRSMDVVLIDTAGRLQNKGDLMQQLGKIRATIQKIEPNAPHETLLVLDSTTGQNAVDQVEIFHSFTPLTGIVLTKLDGSAKGGIILSIYKKFGIPIKWVGVGEKTDDLLPFDKEDYLKALFPR